MLAFNNQVLKRIVKCIRYAASKHFDTMPHITRILFERSGDQVHIVASDEHCIAAAQLRRFPGDDVRAAIQAPVVDYALKTGKDVRIPKDGVLETDSLQVQDTHNLPYPPWEKLMPKEGKSKVRAHFSREVLLDWLKENVYKELTSVAFEADGIKVRVSINDKDLVLMCSGLKGEMEKTYINPKYLMDTLKASRADSVTMYGSGKALDPVVFKTCELIPGLKEGLVVRHLIMPRRGA